MKKIITICFALAIALATTPAWAAKSTINVVVFGDSLTSGYALQPEQAFAARLYRKLRETGYTNVQVTDMGVASDTTTTALDRVGSVADLHPDIVVVELGYNDAIRGVHVEVINNNLSNILSQLTANQATIVLIGVKGPVAMGYQYSEQLASMYTNLASNYKAYFYPNALDVVYGRQEMNLADGYHPNARGVETMVEYMYPLIESVVRWKWQSILQEQEYKEQMEMQLQEQQNDAGR